MRASAATGDDFLRSGLCSQRPRGDGDGVVVFGRWGHRPLRQAKIFSDLLTQALENGVGFSSFSGAGRFARIAHFHCVLVQQQDRLAQEFPARAFGQAEVEQLSQVMRAAIADPVLEEPGLEILLE